MFHYSLLLLVLPLLVIIETTYSYSPTSSFHNMIKSHNIKSCNICFTSSMRPRIKIVNRINKKWYTSRTLHYDNRKRNFENDETEEEQISFHWESFDKKGKWITIDYNKTQMTEPITSHSFNNNSKRNNDIKNELKNAISFAPIQPSSVELKMVRDKLIYIKRDDLLHLRHSNVSGNKARKMFSLNELNVDNFPNAVVSYGGPQSNAMVALAAIVESKNVELKQNGIYGDTTGSNDDIMNEIESDSWIMTDDHNLIDSDEQQEEKEDDDEQNIYENHVSNSVKQKRFIYYTKKLPRYLKNQPTGNLLRALSLGMEMIELKPDIYNDYFGGDNGGSTVAPAAIDAPVPGSSLWVPQGCACGVATQGAKFMAAEIVSFWDEEGNDMPLSVIVPGGTCTTAMLLSRQINAMKENLDINVIVVPCVGDAGYAMRQMRALDVSTGGNGKDDVPQILHPLKQKGYFKFGEPNAQILETFLEMKDEYGIYLDLLYGAPAWNIILQHWEASRYGSKVDSSPLKGRQIMYVHSGGLEGISSQLTRYKHKGLVDSEQVQN